MPANRKRVEEAIARILDGAPAAEKAKTLCPRIPALDPLPPAVHAPSRHKRSHVEKRIAGLAQLDIATGELARHNDETDTESLRGNIESFVG